MKEKEIAAIQTRIITMMGYLQMKVEERDWHGVADAAMDLRDLENYLMGLRFG